MDTQKLLNLVQKYGSGNDGVMSSASKNGTQNLLSSKYQGKLPSNIDMNEFQIDSQRSGI